MRQGLGASARGLPAKIALTLSQARQPNTVVRFDPVTEKFQSWAMPGGGNIVRNTSSRARWQFAESALEKPLRQPDHDGIAVFGDAPLLEQFFGLFVG